MGWIYYFKLWKLEAAINKVTFFFFNSQPVFGHPSHSFECPTLGRWGKIYRTGK